LRAATAQYNLCQIYMPQNINLFGNTMNVLTEIKK